MEEQNKKGRVLVAGDIHGNHKGLVQALERAQFDYENDTLISLGDVVDGHSQSYEVVEELLKIKNLIAIKGNHDDWFNTWIITSESPNYWGQGQAATGFSYMRQLDIEESFNGLTYILKPSMLPKKHKEFFANQLPYYLDNENRLFIHGGFNRHYPLEDQLEYTFWWDRDLWSQALAWESMGPADGIGKPRFKMHGDFEEVFIGHTSTQFWRESTPMHAANIWNLDTGGGWYGYITVMDVDTKQYWQSDSARDLYPEFKGR